MPDEKVHSLTIHLSRNPDIPLVERSPRLLHYHIRVNENTEADLFIQPPKGKPPDWSGFFDGYVDAEEFGHNSSASAALLIKIRGRQFAVTFGNGRFLLRSDSVEDRFGLKVALNSIGEDTIRSIDKHSLDQILRHSREQASRDANTGDFGFDIEQDLLRGVVGKPIDAKTFGQRIAGAESLHISNPVHLSILPEILDKVCDKFLETTYRTKFPWLDHISEVSSAEIEQELDDALIDKIRTGDKDQIWMAVPELIDWNKVRGFRFKARAITPERSDIHLEDFLRAVGGAEGVTRDSLRKEVVSLDHDGRKLHHWSAYRRTYAELERRGDSFLLSGGKWYSVEADFVKRTNAAFERISDFNGDFPEFADEAEEDYLKRVSRADRQRFALMDQKNIQYGGGNSKVEFCDLFSNDHDIFHVKRYGQASALSHLFAQGLISGELFQTDESFRRKVNAKLPDSHRLNDPKVRPGQNIFRVVFAVISDRPGPLQLPFFRD